VGVCGVSAHVHAHTIDIYAHTTYRHTHIGYVHMCVCMCVYVCMSVCVCVHVCVCGCLCFWCKQNSAVWENFISSASCGLSQTTFFPCIGLAVWLYAIFSESALNCPVDLIFMIYPLGRSRSPFESLRTKKVVQRFS